MTIDSTTLSESVPQSAARLDALDRIGVIGYPTKRDEAWRYAPHRRLDDLSFGGSVEAPTELPDLDALLPGLGGPRMVVVNGVFDVNRSTPDCPEGVSITSLADALAADPERLAAHFDRADDDIVDAYVALNIAFGSDGVVVRVADGVIVEVPIHIVGVDVPDGTGTATCTGVVLELGAGSAATVVESRLGASDLFGGSNIRTTITLGENAALEHVVLQDVPTEQIHLSRVEVTQAAGSTFRARSFNLGAAYGRLAYDVRLVGPGATADLSGLFYGCGSQLLDQQLNVVHDAKDCVSRQAYRGVLDDESTGVFNGGISVCPGADGTDAAQTNDNLLLSRRSEINTQPRLEILADEVACKHGATVGQLDEMALYYMRSRGIPAEDSRRLLINGFADQTVDDVGIPEVRAWITHRLGHDDA